MNWAYHTPALPMQLVLLWLTETWKMQAIHHNSSWTGKTQQTVMYINHWTFPRDNGEVNVLCVCHSVLSKTQKSAITSILNVCKGNLLLKTLRSHLGGINANSTFQKKVRKWRIKSIMLSGSVFPSSSSSPWITIALMWHEEKCNY